MGGALNGYRLRSAHGDTIDPRQPLPVDSVEAQQTTQVSDTLIYNGKAAAGAVSIASLKYKPIIEALGSRVGSHWSQIQNRVYLAYADGNPKKEDSWLTSVTETAGSASITIYDPNKNLEEMFESLTTTVKRFIVKVYDKSGGTLYGWIMGVAVASDVYTFDIFNNRLTEGAQNWVGTLSAFDNTALDKVEIYFYNSSLAFGTGTIFTEEVECPKEYSKSRELQLKYAEILSNGQFFVDYMRGELIGVKAAATASETVTYNVWASTAGGATGLASEVKITDGTDTAAVLARTSGTEQPAVTDDALVVYDVGGGAASVSSQYRATTNGQDGTVVYASASTLTLTGTPFTVNSEDLVYVREVDATGNTANIWVNGTGGVHMEISSTTITKSGGSDFSANGVYELGYNGQDKGYDTATTAFKKFDISPLDSHYTPLSIDEDTTNKTNTTHYLPSSTGKKNEGKKDLSFSGKFIDADGTVTAYLEAMNDEDTTSGDWIKVYGYDDKNNLVVNQITVTNGTLTFALSYNNFNYDYYRFVTVFSGATNTSIVKGREKAL